MREYRNYRAGINAEDRIVSGLTGLTYGLAGFIWLIVSHIRGKSLSPFARFHIFQSILIFFGIYVINLIINIFLGFFQIMPFIGPFIVNVFYYITAYPLILGLSLTTFLVQALAVYMAVCGFWGKYAEIPVISDQIRRMI